VAERERRDFLIVGAGPAGLAAAREAARAGVDTCVVDLQSRAGGRHAHDPLTLELVADIQAAGIEVRLDTRAWGMWGTTVATCPSEGHDRRIQARYILLSTGARKRRVVFSGWQLPGVTTCSDDVHGRILLAGNGPGLAARARELHRRGMDLRALVQASASPSDRSIAEDLRRRGVHIYDGHLLVRAEGSDRLEQAIVARVDADWRVQPDTERALDVDAIVLDYGEVPSSEMSRLCGCAHVRSEADSLAPRHDDWMRTDLPGVLVAGDVAGVRGPTIAAEQGRLAGIAVALALESLTLASAERLASEVRDRLDRLTLEHEQAWSDYRVGRGMFDLARPDTVVCHCENVTAAEIEGAVIGASPDAAPVRAETRAGMGICQARDCARQIEALVARACGVPFEAISPLSVRPPVVPIPLGAIAERPVERAQV